MIKIKIWIVILPIISGWAVLSNEPDCKKIKEGEFYFYPPDNSGPFKFVRKDSIQYEIDLQTKDTSIWKLQWLSNCLIKSNFISITKELPKEMIAFFNDHTIYLEIMEVTAKYYRFKIIPDSLTSKLIYTDTAWFNPK